MIKCPVCLADNDAFAITCTSCKGYLQDRVPNLNLFEMGWKVLESPRKAFRTITLAEHKNYVLFLYSMFGVSFSFTAFWYLRLGRFYETLLDLIPWAFGAGIAFGLVALFVLSAVYHGLARIVGGSSGYRNSVASLGYSLTPIVISFFLVLPIELLTFGMYFFTWNPDPYTLNPVSYVVLIGFDVVVVLWSLWLAVLGTRVSHQLSAPRALIAVLGTLILFAVPTVFAIQLWAPVPAV